MSELNAVTALELPDIPDSQPSSFTWVSKSVLAVVDQGLISGSNFLIGVSLARWLAPPQFGAYAVAFSLFLSVAMVHQALLLEPQRVFGPSLYQDKHREYLGILLCFHAVMALFICMTLSFSAWIFHVLGKSPTLPGALAGAALAAPCILLLWVARGAFYVKNSPEMAVKGGLLYCALALLGLLLVLHCGILSPFTAFGVMAIAALATGVFLLILLRPVLNVRANHQQLRLVAEQHWTYGRWALGTSFIGWVNGDIYYPLISIFAGVAAAGTLKALMNLAAPVSQTYTGLSQLYLPHGARIYAQNKSLGLARFTLRITWLFAGGALSYWVMIIMLRQPIFRLVYAGKYVGTSGLLPWIAVASIFGSAISGPVIALRAMQSSYSVFIASAAACVISLAVGIPATRWFGLAGVMPGLVLAAVAPFVITLFMLYRRRGAFLGEK